MHGSVCLLSKYLDHFLNGENLEELDISSASSTDNIFSNKQTLSTGWTGTCPLVNFYDTIYSNFSTQFTSLANEFNTMHNNLLNIYGTLKTFLDNNLYTIRTTTVSRPSAIYGGLTPKCESEFSDKTNTNTIGGQINSNILNKLKPNIEILNTTIKNGIMNFQNNDAYKKSVDDAYENFVKFDQTVASASTVMNTNMIDLKDYFLSLQFNLMFFTWGYVLFFGLTILFYIIYICKESNFLWYIIIILVHLLLIMMLVEVFLSSFFIQVRSICKIIPKAMEFIFTGTYIASGNTASYPAKFGTGNSNMTTMFTNCLNGNGDLNSLFSISNNSNSLSNLKSSVTNLYLQIKEIVDNSNLATKSYDNLDNSIIYKFIIYLEKMKNNLYMATEGFGEDDLFNILRNIRTYLDYQNCSMTNEYFVIKAADCPSGSVQTTTIRDVSGIIHCYVIPNLYSSSEAAYTNSGCTEANRYINLAIPFIKEIINIVDQRILTVRMLDVGYAQTFSELYNEITTLSKKINSTYDLLNSNMNSSSISNCGSVRYDLIDFCDFIGDTTRYDAKIVVIFSAFVGTFGYLMLYTFLVVINSFTYNENYYEDDDYANDSYKNKNKLRNINNNVYKAKPIKRETVDDEEEEEEEEETKKKKLNNNKKNKIPSKTGQKVEMTYLSKNENDSDSS